MFNVQDPRQKVLQMIQNMSPQQKQWLKAMLPKAEQMAKNSGLDFNSVATELNKYL